MSSIIGSYILGIIMPDQSTIHTVLITGGTGYVGAVLVPKLLNKSYRVKIYNAYIYGECSYK